ncbi:unnamed protein product, partial [Darwinula stevensoni]
MLGSLVVPPAMDLPIEVYSVALELPRLVKSFTLSYNFTFERFLVESDPVPIVEIPIGRQEPSVSLNVLGFAPWSSCTPGTELLLGEDACPPEKSDKETTSISRNEFSLVSVRLGTPISPVPSALRLGSVSLGFHGSLSFATAMKSAFSSLLVVCLLSSVSAWLEIELLGFDSDHPQTCHSEKMGDMNQNEVRFGENGCFQAACLIGENEQGIWEASVQYRGWDEVDIRSEDIRDPVGRSDIEVAEQKEVFRLSSSRDTISKTPARRLKADWGRGGGNVRGKRLVPWTSRIGGGRGQHETIITAVFTLAVHCLEAMSKDATRGTKSDGHRWGQMDTDGYPCLHGVREISWEPRKVAMSRKAEMVVHSLEEGRPERMHRSLSSADPKSVPRHRKREFVESLIRPRKRFGSSEGRNARDRILGRHREHAGDAYVRRKTVCFVESPGGTAGVRDERSIAPGNGGDTVPDEETVSHRLATASSPPRHRLATERSSWIDTGGRSQVPRMGPSFAFRSLDPTSWGHGCQSFRCPFLRPGSHRKSRDGAVRSHMAPLGKQFPSADRTPS